MNIFETIAEILGYVAGPIVMLPRVIAQNVSDRVFIVGKVINKFSPMISGTVAVALVGCFSMFLVFGIVKWLVAIGND